MPGFDDNPFAEPTVDNPFADPSVQQVTSTANIAQRGLDNYNPFAGQERPGAPQSGQQSQPAIMRAVSPTPAPPNYTKSAQQPAAAQSPGSNFSTQDFQRRQEELEALARMKEQLQQPGMTNTSRNNNWPPLPASCPMQPCFHQDIDVDIPPPFQRIVRHMYYLWLFHTLVMMMNIVGGMALLIQKGDATTFGLAILYFLLFTPVSFVCWYRPVYKAFRSNSSMSFMMYFFVFFFQFVVTVIQSLGLPGSGTCGVLKAISAFGGGGTGDVAVGLLVLLVAIGFIVAAVADILLITKVHRIYRSTGASFAKAKAEMTSELASNQHVREAATNAAVAAATSQINSSRY